MFVSGDRIVEKPSVYLVGRQTINETALQHFLSDEGCLFETDTKVPAEILAETAGRACYMSYGKGRKTNREYLERIVESHHGSVLEHAVWNFLFTGVSRSLTHELIRHRSGWSYSQLSQRYVDESDARYVVPPLIRDNPSLKPLWLKSIESAHASYVELATALEKVVMQQHPELAPTDRRKKVRETARSVLPNACETKIFVTANARALRHFVELRGSAHADAEIRELAVTMAKLLKEESPNLFADVNIIAEDGIETVSVTHSKI